MGEQWSYVTTLQGINISHLRKRKIIFKMPFLGDMLVPWRVIFLNGLVQPTDFFLQHNKTLRLRGSGNSLQPSKGRFQVGREESDHGKVQKKNIRPMLGKDGTLFRFVFLVLFFFKGYLKKSRPFGYGIYIYMYVYTWRLLDSMIWFEFNLYIY